MLLEAGADVNSQDKGGLIPLHNAASYGHMDMADLLIQGGANINACDRWKFTPLHEAAQKGRLQVRVGKDSMSFCFFLSIYFGEKVH